MVNMLDNWIHSPTGRRKHPSSSSQLTIRYINKTVLREDKISLRNEGNDTSPCPFVGTFVSAVRKCNMN